MVEYMGDLVFGYQSAHFGGSKDDQVGFLLKTHWMERVEEESTSAEHRLDEYGHSWSSISFINIFKVLAMFQ